MKPAKRLIFLAVLVTFTACTDGPFAPWMDLTPPRGGWLWVAKNSNSSCIYKVDVSTGKWIDTLPAPISTDWLGTNLGLAFGDGKLWVSWSESVGDEFDPTSEYYYCWIDPETGEYGQAVHLNYYPVELAWNDPYLWIANSMFHLLEPYTGEVVREIDYPVPGNVAGLTYFDSKLYLLTEDREPPFGEYYWTIYEVDAESGRVLNRITTPLRTEEAHVYAGLAYDGEAFWTSHIYNRVAYRISTDGDILGSFEYDFAGSTWGLAWEFPSE
jgi:hypothetical protein